MNHTRLEIPEAEVLVYSAIFSPAESDRLFDELRDTTQWRQEAIKFYGKEVAIPRLTAWYGDEGTGYKYSGITNVPLAWTPPLLEVKRAVENHCGLSFNSVLLNRYRSGKDSVAWHADDEPEFGENPTIASVSFGATRLFQLRHKKRKELKTAVELTHGSLLVMRGETQAKWVHQIPKTAKPVGERLNLTFRLVIVKNATKLK